VIVPDGRILANLFLSGDLSATSEALFRRDARWVAPAAWRHAFLRMAASHVRGGRTSLDEATAAWRRAQAMMERGEFTVDGAHVLRLSVESGCPVLACEFVAAARFAAAPMVTADRRVLAKFPETAVAPAVVLGGCASA
jgi:hypothetical protein